MPQLREQLILIKPATGFTTSEAQWVQPAATHVIS